jgi:hypothetical protein
MWPDGTTAAAHQAGRFYIQSMQGHDAGCQRHGKKGQGQEFLHVFLLSKITMPFGFGPGDSKSEQNFSGLPRQTFGFWKTVHAAVEVAALPIC